MTMHFITRANYATKFNTYMHVHHRAEKHTSDMINMAQTLRDQVKIFAHFSEPVIPC